VLHVSPFPVAITDGTAGRLYKNHSSWAHAHYALPHVCNMRTTHISAHVVARALPLRAPHGLAARGVPARRTLQPDVHAAAAHCASGQILPASLALPTPRRFALRWDHYLQTLGSHARTATWAAHTHLAGPRRRAATRYWLRHPPTHYPARVHTCYCTTTALPTDSGPVYLLARFPTTEHTPTVADVDSHPTAEHCLCATLYLPTRIPSCRIFRRVLPGRFFALFCLPPHCAAYVTHTPWIGSYIRWSRDAALHVD